MWRLLSPLFLQLLKRPPGPGMPRPGQSRHRPPPTSPMWTPHKAFGSKRAPVTMEVFSDFQCPACKTLYLSTNRRIMDDYVSTGKVYLVHRDFPLAMHAYSRVAGALRPRRCSTRQGSNPWSRRCFRIRRSGNRAATWIGTVAAVLSPAEMAKVSRARQRRHAGGGPSTKTSPLASCTASCRRRPLFFHSGGQTYPYAGVMSYDILKQFLDQLLSGH